MGVQYLIIITPYNRICSFFLIKGGIILYMFAKSSDYQLLNNTLDNELRRISNRLTRIAVILEAFLIVSFPEEKSIVKALHDLHSKLDEAEKLNP